MYEYIKTDYLVNYDLGCYNCGMARTLAKSQEPKQAAEPRGARRKRETRARLLGAALALMAEKGVEGVAINEITEAADVGFGSFYNHFESKEAIYAAVVESLFADFGEWIDGLVAGVSDIAEAVSIAVRHTVMRAQREPLWGRFLIREGLSMRALERGLGERLMRDVRTGIASGRFSDADPFMSFIAVGGTVLLSISAALSDLDPKFNTKGLPERAARSALHTLGLAEAEAERISKRPLPR
jgi:AcrR family transcriptional regulator